MPVTAGVIDILHGVAAMILGIFTALVSYSLGNLFGSGPPWYTYWLVLGIIVAGSLAITGGIYALKRKIWPLALGGAIASFALTLWSLEYWINIGTYGLSINTLYGFAPVPAIFSLILTFSAREQFKE